MPQADSRKLEYGPVFSWAREHAGLIYTSGHAAVDVDTNVLSPGKLVDEARLALQNLERTLKAAGSSMDKVVRVTVYLTDMTEYAAFNEVYARFFPGKHPPARTCVEVRRLPYNFRVEIDAIAHR